jgi:hypothetical protein
MSELHWTGAALLLAVAVPGRGSARPRRGAILSWADFARQHGLDDVEHSATDQPAGSPAAADGTPANARPGRELTAGAVSTAQPKAAQRWAGTSVAATVEAERPEQSPQRMLYRAEATCSHCGRTAGDLEWDTAAPGEGIVLRPATGGASQPVPRGVRLRCEHCGGPLFAERPERVLEWPSIVLARTPRGRPRKTTTLRAS